MSRSTRTQRFEDLVLPHLDSAFNLASWLTRNRHDAEDVVQEACLRAYRFFDGFHGEDGRAWLLGIVRNTFLSWYQSDRARPCEAVEDFSCLGAAASATMDEGDNNPEARLRQKDSERRLLQALQALPIEFREVMVMRELEDLSYKQIAAIVDIPIGTVMSRLARGRKLLAASLMSEGGEA